MRHTRHESSSHAVDELPPLHPIRVAAALATLSHAAPSDADAQTCRYALIGVQRTQRAIGITSEVANAFYKVVRRRRHDSSR